jgi:hypothetical protein
LTDDLYGTLSPESSAALQAHVENCRACRTLQVTHRRQREALRGLASLECPAPLAARALERWDAEGRATSRPRPKGWHFAPVGAGFALACAAGAGLLVTRAHPSRTQLLTASPVLVRSTPGSKARGVSKRPPAAPNLVRLPPVNGFRMAADPGPRAPEKPSWRDRRGVESQDDTAYLNGRDPGLVASWLTGNPRDDRAMDWLQRPIPAVQDDFVRVPLPRVATADGNGEATRDAVKKYEEEAKVVDGRLFHKVTLRQKAVSLDELCEELSRQTDVSLHASRGVGDENATVLVKERPAREVMREISRLFGFYWNRTGEAGHYRYELVQDLRSQLAEDEMRRRDADAALLSLHDKMEALRPYLGLSPAELRARAEKASGDQQELLRSLSFQWGGLQLYPTLTPAQFSALRNGERLGFRMLDGAATPNPSPTDGVLPREWRDSLLQAAGVGEVVVGNTHTLGLVQPGQLGQATPFLGLRLNRSELGQVSLEVEVGVSSGEGGLSTLHTMAQAQSPSVQSPDNAASNRALRTEPEFQREVSYRPEVSCPRWKAIKAGKLEAEPEEPFDRDPHYTTADVWEAIHDATGLPIVADAYSREYAATDLSAKQEKLFAALCRTSDRLGCRWRKDGDYLLARSTSYFWDKLKEVPRRDLERWRDASTRPERLPLEALLEMMRLSDRQLDSEVVGRSIYHCWGLEEWGMVGSGSRRMQVVPASIRTHYRLLASLSEAQLRQSQKGQGLPFGSLTPPQQQLWLKTNGAPPEGSIHVRYAPAGGYSWQPLLKRGSGVEEYLNLPVVVGHTAEQALADARRIEPGLSLDRVKRCGGLLMITYRNRDGSVAAVIGRPPVFYE